MCGGHFAQPLGCLLRRQIALRLGEHFVADHEFFDRGRAQQRRIKVRMQLPVVAVAGVVRSGVPAHRIRKRGLKQIVVADQQRLQHFRKAGPFRVGQFRQPPHWARRQQQDFIGPDRPEWNHGNPVRVAHHDPRLRGQFALRVVEQQHRAFFLPVVFLLALFGGDFVRHEVAGPDLPVRMRIGAAHRRPFILEHLHPAIALAEFRRLRGPHVHHLTNVRHGHLRQREIMSR